jgi:transcriptional regulator of heat shock response
MDPSTFHDLWINLATNSPFLGWMIYSYVQTNKDLKETREESKAEAKEIRKEAKVEEQRVRDRFEKVIKDLNEDRNKLVEGFSNRIDSLERGQKKIFHLLGELSDVKEKITKIEMKEEIRKEIQ